MPPLLSRNQGTWQRLFRLKRRRNDACFVFPAAEADSRAPGGPGTAAPSPATPQTSYDLISAGIHGLLGVGVFVAVGQVVKDFAGPSILLSLVIAAATCLVSGICYAELCARCSERRGGAYTYIYYTSGEFLAYICACATFIQHTCAIAVSGRAISRNFDFLLGNEISNVTIANVGYIRALQSCPDFVAMVIVFLLTTLVAFGLKTLNPLMKLVCNGIIFLIVVLIVSFGLFGVDIKNWTNVRDFFPYQLQGVFVGAAGCCVLFLGLDSLLSETSSHVCRKPPFHSPNRGSSLTLHISLLATLIIALLLLLSVSVILSLIVDTSSLTGEAPLAAGLDIAGVTWLRYIFFIGVVVALVPFACDAFSRSGELLLCLAEDGLVPALLGQCSSRSGLPVAGVLVQGVLAAGCALLFNLSQMLGTLVLCVLAVQVLASVSLTVLRYQPRRTYEPSTKHIRRKRRKKKNAQSRNSALRNDLHLIHRDSAAPVAGENNNVPASEEGAAIRQQRQSRGDRELRGTLQLRLDDGDDDHTRSMDNVSRTSDSSSGTDIDDVVDEYKEKLMVATSTGGANISHDFPTPATAKRASWCVCAIVTLVTTLSALLIHAHAQLLMGSAEVIAVLCVCVSLLLAVVVFLALQPREDWRLDELTLTTPFIPWLPTIAILLATHLMLRLPLVPWLIFSVLLTTGLVFYFTYGIRNSHQVSSYEPANSEERVLLDSTDDDPVVLRVDSAHEPNRDERLNSATQRRIEQVDVLIIE